MSAAFLVRKSSLKSPFNASFTRSATTNLKPNHVRFNLGAPGNEVSVEREKENASFIVDGDSAERGRLSRRELVSPPVRTAAQPPVGSSELRDADGIRECFSEASMSESARAGSAAATAANGNFFRFGTGSNVAGNQTASQTSDFTFRIESPFLPAHFLPPSLAENSPSSRAVRRTPSISQSGALNQSTLDGDVSAAPSASSRRLSSNSFANRRLGVPTASLADTTFNAARKESPIQNASRVEPMVTQIDTSPSKATSSGYTSPKRFPELLNVSSGGSRTNVAELSVASVSMEPANFGTTTFLRETERPRVPGSSRWVTVFGFPPEFAQSVRHEFEALGPAECVTDGAHSRALHLRFLNEADAANAVRRNGALLRHGNATFRVGVCECSEPPSEYAGVQGNASRVGWWQADEEDATMRSPVSPRRTVLEAVRSRPKVGTSDSPTIRNLALRSSNYPSSNLGNGGLNSTFCAQRSDLNVSTSANSAANLSFNDSRVRLGKRSAAWLPHATGDEVGLPRKRTSFLAKALDYVFGK